MKQKFEKEIFILGLILITMSLLQYYAQVRETISKQNRKNNQTTAYTAYTTNLNPDRYLYPTMQSKKIILDLRPKISFSYCVKNDYE